MKIAIVSEVIDRLIVIVMLRGEGGQWVNSKLLLKFSHRRFTVVIQINIKMRSKSFDKPMTIIGNAASLWRERRKPGYLPKSVSGGVQGAWMTLLLLRLGQ